MSVNLFMRIALRALRGAGRKNGGSNYGSYHYEAASRSGRPFRHQTRKMEPQDEEVHLRGEKRHPHHRPAAHGDPHRRGVQIRVRQRERGQDRPLRRHQEAGAGSHQGRGGALRSVLRQFPLAGRMPDQLQDHALPRGQAGKAGGRWKRTGNSTSCPKRKSCS